MKGLPNLKFWIFGLMYYNCSGKHFFASSYERNWSIIIRIIAPSRRTWTTKRVVNHYLWVIKIGYRSPGSPRRIPVSDQWTPAPTSYQRVWYIFSWQLREGSALSHKKLFKQSIRNFQEQTTMNLIFLSMIFFLIMTYKLLLRFIGCYSGWLKFNWLCQHF